MKDLKDILAHPYNQKDWTDFLTQLFHEKDSSSDEGILSTPQRIAISNGKVKEAYELGSYLTSDERLIGIYQVNISEDMLLYRNKVGLRKLMAKIYKYNVDGVLVAFVQEKKWRLSFISEFVKEIDHQGKMIKQITDEKRFTYLLGEGEKTKTATDRLKKLVGKPLSLQDFFEVFSVEMLSKDFFREYKEIYEEFFAEIFKEEHNQALFKGNDKAVRDFVKRMMGRIVFLYFIQKKGWLAVPKGKNWGEGNHNYLYHLYQETPKEDWPYFYEKRLVPLFFDTLTDKSSESEDNSLRFPYLNGGLFDKSQDENFDSIVLPYETFSRLFDTFDKYNFTVYEDSPNEHTIAVDPEMLGHIFENLLEDNKDKGAFYTPKEIVHYMCKESLKTFLLSKITFDDSSEKIKDVITKIIEHQPLNEDEEKYIREKEHIITTSVENVKICDPAIGSGAFPMGLLQEIYYLKVTLQQLGIIPEQNDAQIKKHIIEQTIYGVDIDSGAVDIARLRFWLSLVVDEPKPQPLPNLDFKIMQGNSLLESYQGVDLSHIGKEEEIIVDDLIDFGDEYKSVQRLTFFSDAKEKIQQLIKNYFTSTEDKTLKRKEINDLIEGKIHYKIIFEKRQVKYKVDLFEKKFGITSEEDLTEKLQKGTLTSKGKEYKAYIADKKRLLELDLIENELISFQTKIERPYFLWHTYFKDVFDKGGFDIVIGNPPYVQLQNNGGKLAALYEEEGFETFARSGDIYCLFYEKAYQLLKQGGICNFITSNKWMRAGYGQATRKFFLEHTNPLILIDFAGIKVFETATVDVNILLYVKEKPTFNTWGCTIKDNELKKLSLYVRQHGGKTTFSSDESWVILSEIEQRIKAKIEAIGTPLKEWNVNIYRGVLTGYNDAFIIDKAKKEEILANCQSEEERKKTDELIRPILRGRDIKRYGYDWKNLYVITARLVTDIPNNYPAVCKHLEQFKGKGKLGDNSTTKVFKRPWWAWMQEPVNYWEDFSKQKIMYPNMTKFMPFLLDNTGFFINDKGFIITGNHLSYLVAFFNSNIFKICYRDSFPELQGGTRELRKIFFDQVKIPNIQHIINEDFDILVDDIQKGKDNASLRLERALILALGLEKFEDYILSYDINLQ